ncbi:MAG: TPM domain-containing protein, partial [Deltaproteobacteria bacterium]|nr:TPM domain-containing protein [Deltaproteobacteria bacterium]
IGKRGEDNGLLLLVAPAERRMHIEVGYGLEARLPDAFVGRTIREVITPRFKAGDYDRGIVEGVQTLVRRLETGETFPEQTVRRATSLWGIWSRAAWFLLLPMFVFLPLVMRRQPILGILGIGVFTVVTGSLLLGFFLLAIAMRWLVDGAAAGSSTGRWRSGGFGGGFGGFGGGFGGFSGGSSGGFGGFGGGRSGGGGASGSW